MIDLNTILTSGEKITVEAKLAKGGLPNSVWDTYSAFANSFGGTILLGVDEDKETKELVVTGIDNPAKMISDIWNIVNNPNKVNTNILFEEHVYEMTYNERKIVVIEVPRADRRDKPVYINNDMFKGTFRRNNEGDYHCKKAEVLAMLRDSSEESADSKVLEDCPMDYLNQDSINTYRNAFKNLRKNHVWTNISDAEFLTKIGAARRGSDGKLHPTLAGLIFFGDFTYITDILPDYFLDYRDKKGGKNRWSDRVCSGDGNWSGNIFDFYFRIIDKLTADVEKPFKLDSNSLRVEETNVHDSIREALANALIHSDYYGRRGIVIEKEFKTIKISNPGTFRVNIDAAIDGGISDARNAKIFNMFTLIQVGERSGMGLCDLYDTWEKNGFSRPKLEETLDPERVTLTLQLDANEANCDTNEVNCEVNDTNLSVNEKHILSIIKTDSTLSIPKMAEQIGISKASADRAIKTLKAKGYIARKGSTRGKWIILK